MFVFLSLFPVFIIVASLIILIIHTSFCPSTLGPLCHHSSRKLTALFSSVCLPVLGHVECPLLALMVPETLTFLPSSVSANLTIL